VKLLVDENLLGGSIAVNLADFQFDCGLRDEECGASQH